MRVTPALSQSLLHRIQRSAVVSAGVALVALTVSGCAGNTTLGEKSNNIKENGTPVMASNGAQTTTVTQLQSFMWFFSPYRPVIQQGNFVSEEMLAQLKVGMTKDQVRFIFGTSLLMDPFHGERWDYPFRLAKGNGEITTSRVVVFFKDDKVERFEGGNLPTEKEYIARIAGPAPISKNALKPQNKPSPTSAPLPAGNDTGEPKPVELSTKPKTQE
jgi:outer membrane protein assembly factor BamE